MLLRPTIIKTRSGLFDILCMKTMVKNFLNNNQTLSSIIFNRLYASSTAGNKPCGTAEVALVLGVYRNESDDIGGNIFMTPTGERFNDKIANRLKQYLRMALPVPALGEVRILYGLDPHFSVVAVAGLGDHCYGFNFDEQIDERKEAIRIGIGAGVRSLQEIRAQKIYIDSCEHAESAAEGASLASWVYQELKDNKNRSKLTIPILQLFDSCDWDGWQIGLHKASAQNLARHMMETPSNLLTPSAFAQSAVEILSKYAINIEVRMQNWAKLRNMNAFLAVGTGSCEPPVFLELLYEGCDPAVCPVVLIGKGVTFDSGGLCLKDCKDMRHERGDMGGAAIVIAIFRAIASLQLPLNVRGLIPLCVNSIGATSYKPGDTIRAMNGKTILIENTDHAEGLLLLADALCYSKMFNPKFVIDVGTLVSGSTSAMGTSASIVTSNSDSLYETLRIASIHTGDRIWRFPLWGYFDDYVHANRIADITNMAAPGTGGEPARAAAFLSHFLPDDKDWLHIDNYNVTMTSGKVYSYLRRGMAGRPTRTLIEFLAQLCCKETIEKHNPSQGETKNRCNSENINQVAK